MYFFFYFVKILFIHLTESEDKQGETGRGEAGSQVSREPDVGLDLRTPGSWTERKADT